MNHAIVDGGTPLIFAIVGNKLENVKLLIECGADVEKVDDEGKTFRVILGKYDLEKKTFVWDKAGASSIYNGQSELVHFGLLVLSRIMITFSR